VHATWSLRPNKAAFRRTWTFSTGRLAVFGPVRLYGAGAAIHSVCRPNSLSQQKAFVLYSVTRSITVEIAQAGLLNLASLGKVSFWRDGFSATERLSSGRSHHHANVWRCATFQASDAWASP